MTRPTLRQLEYLVAAVETQSFTRVAQKLHVSQAAVSSAIAELERLLGVRLFHRSAGQGVIPTLDARRTANEAQLILNHADALSSDYSNGIIRGNLRYGVMRGFSPAFVPSVMQRLSDRHPDLKSTFREDEPTVLEQEILHSRLDIALLYDRQLSTALTRVPLASIRPHVVLSAKHPLSNHGEVSLADLRDDVMVVFEMQPIFERLTSLVAGVTGAMPQVLPVQTSGTLYAMVARGMGYSLAYISPGHRVSYDGRAWVARPLKEPVTENLLVAALLDSMNSPAIRAVIAATRQHIRQLSNGSEATAFMTQVGREPQ